MKEKKTRVEEIDRNLEANARDAEDVARQVEKARERCAEIDAEYATAREERREITARGGDPAEVSSRLRTLRDEREGLEDTTSGLLSRAEELEEEKRALLDEREAARLAGLRERLRRAVTVYNEAAERFAPAAAALRDLQDEAGDADVFGALASPVPGWRESFAGLSLPVLFATDKDELPRYDFDDVSLYHVRPRFNSQLTQLKYGILRSQKQEG